VEVDTEQKYLELKGKAVGVPLSIIETLLNAVWEEAYEAGYDDGFDSGWTEGVLDYKGERKFL
jgi:hypothetical protein